MCLLRSVAVEPRELGRYSSSLLIWLCSTRTNNIYIYIYIYIYMSGPRQLSRYSESLRAGRSGDRIPVGARFSAPVQTGPGTNPASCTMGTGSFPGVKWPGRGVDHLLHLAFRLKEDQSYTCTPPLGLYLYLLSFLHLCVCVCVYLGVHKLRATRFCTIPPDICRTSI